MPGPAIPPTLEPALEARAGVVLARHRAAFSRRFALSEPSDGDWQDGDSIGTTTRETVEQFLARTAGSTSR